MDIEKKSWVAWWESWFWWAVSVPESQFGKVGSAAISGSLEREVQDLRIQLTWLGKNDIQDTSIGKLGRIFLSLAPIPIFCHGLQYYALKHDTFLKHISPRKRGPCMSILLEAKFVDFVFSLVMICCCEVRETDIWAWMISKSVSSLGKTWFDQNWTRRRQSYVLPKDIGFFKW